MAYDPTYLRASFIAKASIPFFMVIGIVEVLSGSFSGSVALVSDGVHTLSDGLVSGIVWIGLRFARRGPDGKFHFGYYKVENLAALVAAFAMAAIGVLILVRSYTAFFDPQPIEQSTLPLVVAAIASISFWTLGLYKRKIAKAEKSKSLLLDAYNTLKSGLSSLMAFFAVLLSSFFVQIDALAGIAISFFIFVVVVTSIRESAMVLVDACNCDITVDEIKKTVSAVDGVKEVREARLRPYGPNLLGQISVQVDGSLSVRDSDSIVKKVKKSVRDLIPAVSGITVEVESSSKVAPTAKKRTDAN
ncbi:MAG: cation transporter [Thaumarchaeota archaeon]|nr:cation transporter [Nitrososphaerota archaeon]